MTALALALLAALAVATIAVWTVRRRAMRRERRRVTALTELAGRLDATAASFPETRTTRVEALSRAPAPLVGVEPGGRAALVDAATTAVRRARGSGARLAVAVVESEDRVAVDLARDVGQVVGMTTYTVGPRSIAVVLPGAGRAEALGVLARIQAACGVTGRAFELEPVEDAVELLARVLEPVPAGD